MGAVVAGEEHRKRDCGAPDPAARGHRREGTLDELRGETETDADDVHVENAQHRVGASRAGKKPITKYLSIAYGSRSAVVSGVPATLPQRREGGLKLKT